MNDRLIEIVEDYALLEDFLLSLSSGEVPSRIPSLHNTLLMDALGVVCERLRGGVVHDEA